MKRVSNNDHHVKKRLPYLLAAVFVIVFAAVTAFAQEAPEATLSPDPAQSAPPGADATASPSPEATLSPEVTQSPEAPALPTASPEPEVTQEAPAAPTDMATPPPSASQSADVFDAEDHAASEIAPASPAETVQTYNSPAVFLSSITARGNNDTLQLSEQQRKEIARQLPAELSPYRREIVMQAYSLVGKVHYFWGGKSTAAGWDTRWGNEAIVGSAGSAQTGTTRSYGLDCSGYVLWSLVNAEQNVSAHGALAPLKEAEVATRVGYGTAEQWSLSEDIAWESVQPGDLAFYGPPASTPRNHVGIVVGKNETGELLVAHCSSSQNNVIISEARHAGFRYMRGLRLVAEREAGYAAAAPVNTLKNGLPLTLTDEQAYKGALINGWEIDLDPKN